MTLVKAEAHRLLERLPLLLEAAQEDLPGDLPLLRRIDKPQFPMFYDLSSVRMKTGTSWAPSWTTSG
jgi:hypothetical protein